MAQTLITEAQFICKEHLRKLGTIQMNELNKERSHEEDKEAYVSKCSPKKPLSHRSGGLAKRSISSQSQKGGVKVAD